MNGNRLLKYINSLAALLLIAAGAGIYWFAWRPQATTSGSLAAPAGAPVTISRDSLGVPRIKAASIEDAIFAHGYVAAQDRLFQMEFARRQAAGELAEWFGPRAVESDLEARRLRLRSIADAHAATLPAEDRRWLAAYARGVNYFLETHQGRLPVEFALLASDPAPWRTADTMLVLLQMYRQLGSSWRDEKLKRDMLAAGDRQKVELLFPLRGGPDEQAGSNAWAISGRFTRSGRPLLANDPHLGWSLPGVWHQVHLEAPGLNVAGASIPGAPGVVIGHNEQIAWGFTILAFDVQDLYIESVQGQRFRWRGIDQPLRRETEVVRIRGGARIDIPVFSTQHGPVFLTEGGTQMATRWAAAEPGGSVITLQLNRARNWQEFRTALSRYSGPPMNAIYADRDGNIGYQATGRMPVRRKHAGDVPVDGASGEFEWDGFIPFEDLPSILNPPGGLIVSANQNPFPPDFKYPVNGSFTAPYRMRQIRDRLRGRTGLSPQDMLRVQTDVYSAFSHYLASQFVSAVRARSVRNPSLQTAAEILSRWNGQMAAESGAALIVTLGFQHLRRNIADLAAKGKGAAWETHMAPAVLERLLRERPVSWSSDFDALLVRVLDDAVEEGVRMMGPDPGKWRYGRYNELLLANPVMANVPGMRGWLGSPFRIGPAAMSGSTTTVSQTTRRLGPSMRMTVDLGDFNHSLFVLPAGQSGQGLSPHYKDQWETYVAGRANPWRFTGQESRAILTLTPR